MTERSSWNGEKIYTSDGTFYRKVDLDFNVEEAEEATIDGWVARDEDGNIYAYWRKPIRGNTAWLDNGTSGYEMLLKKSFPSLTWESDPIEVTVTVKPKKQ